MAQNNSQDWRIEDYYGDLNGASFQFKKFVSTKANDHEHCVFCWQKITDLEIEEADTEGFCTFNSKTGQENWVCKKCFNDFNKQFGFELK